jgi:hypothetical protein
MTPVRSCRRYRIMVHLCSGRFRYVAVGQLRNLMRPL